MDIVKCPKCSAEQEIYVNSEKQAVCVFCGEPITDLPEGFVAEEHMTKVSAEEEAQPEVKKGTGEEIFVEYTLSYDDVKFGLYETGRIKRKRTGAIIETVIIAAFLGLQIYNIFKLGFSGLSGSDYFMTVVMLLLIPFIWLTPVLYEKKYIKSIADGTKLYAKIYEDLLIIEVEGGEKPSEVPLDKTSVFFDNEQRFFLVIPNGSVIILPKRYIDEKDLPIVEQRLKEGTLDKFPQDTQK